MTQIDKSFSQSFHLYTPKTSDDVKRVNPPILKPTNEIPGYSHECRVAAHRSSRLIYNFVLCLGDLLG